MQKCRPLTFVRLVSVPEIHSALVAVRNLSEQISSRQFATIPIPLYAHGRSGTGKTHLVSALVEDVIQHAPRSVVSVVPATEITAPAILPEMDPLNETDELRQWKGCDLLIVEDLQYLAKGSGPVLARLIDNFQVRQVPLVVTASVSPRELDVGFRLSSRLTGGLVVELQYPGVSSRLAILQQKTQERQLAVSREVITWLAEHLKGGSRELEGAVTKLESISRATKNLLDIATIASHFQEDDKAAQPSIDKIVQKVSGYFRIPRSQLSSGTRNRNVVLPRQLGMYLSRRLTDLSLQEIGTHFGGRDHTTVLHACRKVETALCHDAALAGTVQQLRAELT